MDLNPFDYSLSEMRKAIVALITFGGMCAMLIFSGYDPGFTEALIALSGSAFGIIGVFLATNHTPGDLQKALEQAKAAVFTFVGYFVVIPTSTGEKAVIIIGMIVSVYGVYYRANVPEASPPPPGS